MSDYRAQVFKQMKIRQVVPPESRGINYINKIALIGCGPASLSCATFLARMGYKDVTIFEKQDYVGGLR